MDARQRALLIASVAGLVAAAATGFGQTSQAHAQEGEAHCYGVNKCKGTGDCGGKGTSCAGTNGCKAQGFISMDEDDCLRLEGGRLTPEPATEPQA